MNTDRKHSHYNIDSAKMVAPPYIHKMYTVVLCIRPTCNFLVPIAIISVPIQNRIAQAWMLTAAKSFHTSELFNCSPEKLSESMHMYVELYKY